ncbi:helix-turn-helix transcriptional regulator [Halorubrum ezzemoulense]|uniref:helix-turn-helix transcriptional regulator n=1 Tax=Halorubrum ezzemoulense TaxID=337243 RepID=UPI00232FC6C0|nr:transcriptional regulator [Halorubrum ezzemoulense]MDB2224019.1 transcriptional regulator [Halorubrum ezzemoulense]MDB9252711.1 transcriptional regulator [Halorubrum ezzemoulense]MDB9257234.1 transcriptional regulator [Halorubrum ezzemoulense]MDB9277214.1 transcriptional regulator [Halorubrum ezzemoulense]
MRAEDGHDGAQYLAGSPVRVAILRALRDDPRRPAELTDAVDATRTTVQRILGGFRERDWVVKRDAAYRVTPTGERVHDAYETLLTEVERGERYGGFAETLERAGVDFPPEGIPDSDITVASEKNPLAVVDRLTELLHENHGGEIRAVSPVVIRQFNDAAAAALDDGANVELIIDRDAADTSVAEFEPATDRALDDDAAEVYVSAEPIEYGLFRCGDVACVAAYDEQNNPRCVIESTDDPVVDWVDDAFASLRADATRLSTVVERA